MMLRFHQVPFSRNGGTESCDVTANTNHSFQRNRCQLMAIHQQLNFFSVAVVVLIAAANR
jgi:hypothetical protein